MRRRRTATEVLAAFTVLASAGCGLDDAGQHRRLWEQQHLSGDRFFSMGNRVEAEKAYRACLREARAIKPADVRLLISLNSLGRMAEAAGDDRQAEKLFFEAVGAYGKIRQTPRYNTNRQLIEEEQAAALLGLAECRQRLGQLAPALADYESAIRVYEELLAADKAKVVDKLLGHDLCRSLLGLARLHQALGRTDLAESGFQRALAEAREYMAPDSLMQEIVEHYAGCLRNAGKATQADHVEEEARSAQLGRHLAQDRWLARFRRGRTQLVRRNYAAAASLLLAAADEARQYEQPDMRLSRTLQELCQAQMSLGRLDEARQSAQEGISVAEKAVGPESEEVEQLLGFLAGIEFQEKHYDQARLCAQRQLKIAEKLHGPDDPGTVDAVMELGRIALSEGQYAEAAKRYKRALAVLRTSFSWSGYRIFHCLRGLALACIKMHDYGQAESYLRQAIEACDRSGMGESPEVAALLRDYGYLLRQTGRQSQAVEMEARAARLAQSADVAAGGKAKSRPAAVPFHLQDYSEPFGT